ncbi:MAG TPA: hypothetical protein VFG99_03905 [Chloroflexia bacterium]|nr:hypothetical protein [Chloroflexia bacterium]
MYIGQVAYLYDLASASQVLQNSLDTYEILRERALQVSGERTFALKYTYRHPPTNAGPLPPLRRTDELPTTDGPAVVHAVR